MEKFDIAIIGGGPGGYPAALKASHTGKSVALIECDKMGGTCLNVGCIPTKTLIASADLLAKMQHAEDFGITVKNVSYDYAQMVSRKDRVVTNIRKGLEQLIAASNITVFKGFGEFVSPYEIKIKGKDNTIIKAEKIIIATGSTSMEIPSFPFDYKRIHDSTSLLELKKLPKSLVIVGGGVIGCEFASFFVELGVKITIIEALPSIIPMESKAVTSVLASSFQKKGITIKTEAMVEKIDTKKDGITVHIKNAKSIDAEMALVAVGRKANIKGLGLEKAGIKVTERGTIPVDDHLETNVPGIYAIGDVTGGRWMLAHVATHQGITAAENALKGKEMTISNDAVPSVIFTNPEIASVGLSLEEAQEKGYDAQVGAFPYKAIGKAQSINETEGFAQIIVDKSTGQILGAQVVGYEATALIAEMTVAITNELTIESITETIHSHPTISEIWMEAAFMAEGHPLHLPLRRKND